MKIYIAGKITGLNLEDAKALFAEAENHLFVHGHTPLNPFKISPVCEAKSWVDYMCDDLRYVLSHAEALYMLPNWRDSQGARVEHAVACEMKMPIFYAASELPAGCDWPDHKDAAA